MINYLEKKRVYDLDTNLVVQDLKDELSDVLENTTNTNIKRLRGNAILNETSFLPILYQIHKKWRQEFEKGNTLIEEVCLCLTSDNTKTLVWKPSIREAEKENLDILFGYNFTQTMEYK